MFTTAAITVLIVFVFLVIFIFRCRFIKEQTTFYDRIFISMAVGVIAFFIVLAFKNNVEIENVKPGQIYKYSYSVDDKNPFLPVKRFRYFRVIDVKDGYVLYTDTTGKDTSSSTIQYFLIGSELIK
jgi:hypothetical protein